jgi:hypothetical protein
MVILTQRELIVVSEGEGGKVGEYAGVWTYLRRAEFERVWIETVGAGGGEVRKLCILMSGGPLSTVLLGKESEPDVACILRELLPEIPPQR